jgi:hypothetical protein
MLKRLAEPTAPAALTASNTRHPSPPLISPKTQSTQAWFGCPDPEGERNAQLKCPGPEGERNGGQLIDQIRLKTLQRHKLRQGLEIVLITCWHWVQSFAS